MTAKNRHKSSNASEKNAAAAAAAAPSSTKEDAPKKSQKSPATTTTTSATSTTSNGVSGPGPQQGPRSGSCLGTIVNALFYIALIGAAGFAAFSFQQVVEEFRETNARHEESARQSAELGKKMDSVVQQVESLSSIVDGLESSLGITRVELEGAVGRMKRGEVETRRVEDALHKLQNDLLRDLSEGIKEVKEARERDFSSLESTVEDRLAEVSQSIAASVAEFTGAQGEAQSQLADIKARMGDMGDPAQVKQELAAIVEAVAQISEAKEGADASVSSLREQIGAVREELQTRNQEVASLSQDMENMRAAVQENVGSLRQSLNEAEAEVGTLKDKSTTLEGGLEQAAAAVQSVEKLANANADQASRTSEELEGRLKAAEESRESLSASLSDLTTQVEALLTKYDVHESSLAAQGKAMEKVQSGLEQEIEALRSSLVELQANVKALTSMDSSLGEKVGGVEKRLAAVEEERGNAAKPEQLQNLSKMVAGLEAKAAKLEGHDKAIAALQKSLQQTTKTLAGLSKAPGKKK